MYVVHSAPHLVVYQQIKEIKLVIVLYVTKNFVNGIFPVWIGNGYIVILLNWVGHCTYCASDLMFMLV